MQNKLITLAVSSALAAIGAAPALAQNATVNVFGTLYGEYSHINNGAKSATEPYQSYDHFQNPGSEIGFRGEEKLGGGLSAWFQCTSSMDYRGPGNSAANNSQGGSLFCTRNSALGMKGGFGNVFYGNWQTPWTRINNMGNVGSNDTGVFGNAHIIAGTSSTFGMSSPTQLFFSQGTNGFTSLSAINTTQAGAWRRRQNNLFTYETPNFAGFTAMGSVTTRNNASAATNAQFKTRLWSLGAQYANGPLTIGLAYEKHKDFYYKTFGAAAAAGTAAPGTALTTPGVTVAAGAVGAGGVPNCTPGAALVVPNATSMPCTAGSENAWTIAGAYTFANNLRIGGSYQRFKAEGSNFDPATGLGGDTKLNTYHLGIDWMITGPHGVRAAWSRAGNVSGAFVQAVPTAANPTGVTGTASALRPQAGPNSGADMWQIRYVHMLSKRTELTLGASWTKNDSNGIYETGGATTVQFKGQDTSAYAVTMRHNF